MSAERDLVVAALRAPQDTRALTLADWDLLVRQARAAGLLARLAALLGSRDLLAEVPPAPAVHLLAAARVAAAQRLEVEREIVHVQHALRELPGPLVLLKGAAYLAAGLPAAVGRVFSDTDILVPRTQLAAAESALLLHGWAGTHHSAYDQRYYREWMHELPPLVHLRRQTALDVHHAIAPETARLRPPSALLLQAVQPIAGRPGLATLAPADMVLHSMLHLNVNDELSHALRDLSDLDLLLRHFGADPAFWPALVARSRELGLAGVLRQGLRMASRVFETPVPAAALSDLADAAPGRLRGAWMDSLWARALRPRHRSLVGPLDRVALSLLYVRAHWMRMPAGLLVRHLTVKALRRPEQPAA
jgi:hypothetical protein